ncbi:unnamed protein product, partial [Cyprideis torosa]
DSSSSPMVTRASSLPVESRSQLARILSTSNSVSPSAQSASLVGFVRPPSAKEDRGTSPMGPNPPVATSSSSTEDQIREFESIFHKVISAKEKTTSASPAPVRPPSSPAVRPAPVRQPQAPPLTRPPVENPTLRLSTPPPAKPPRTPVLDVTSTGSPPSNVTTASVQIPKEYQVQNIPDHSQVTLSINTGVQGGGTQIRLLGAALKALLASQNPGFSSGSHKGPLVLNLMYSTISVAPNTVQPATGSAVNKGVATAPAGEDSCRTRGTLLLAFPAAGPLNKDFNTLGSNPTLPLSVAVPATSKAVPKPPPPPPLTPPPSSSVLVASPAASVTSTGSSGSGGKGGGGNGGPKSSSSSASSSNSSKPSASSLTPIKDDPDVVSRVTKLLDEYKQQLEQSPEQQFKPAPRRNSYPKGEAAAQGYGSSPGTPLLQSGGSAVNSPAPATPSPSRSPCTVAPAPPPSAAAPLVTSVAKKTKKAAGPPADPPSAPSPPISSSSSDASV